MGSRGPQPTPSAIKHQRGTFRPDRAATHEPSPIGAPTCPKWLVDTDARKEFKRLVKLLSAMGVVGKSDENILARYATLWVRWRRVVQLLMTNHSQEFVTYVDGEGNVKAAQVSAIHSAERSLADQLSRCEGSLGMNPSARSRINVTMPTAPAQPDSKSQFFSTGPFKIAP